LFHDKERVFLISTTHGAEMSSLGAFVETLNVYRELDVVGNIWAVGRRLMDGMNQIASEFGISEYFQFCGVPCSPYFVTKDSDGQDSLWFRTLFLQEMVKNQVLIPWVALCYMHAESDIARALEAGRNSLEVYRRALSE